MLACATFCLPAIGSPNYIVNGGFETGATAGVLSPTLAGPPNNYLIYVFGVGGATDIGGWTVSTGPKSNRSTTPLSLLVTGNPPQTPASGSYAVDFDPFWNISTGEILGPTVTGTLPELSQTMILPAGDYLLSFDGALETGGAVGTLMGVKIDSALEGQFRFGLRRSRPGQEQQADSSPAHEPDGHPAYDRTHLLPPVCF